MVLMYLLAVSVYLLCMSLRQINGKNGSEAWDNMLTVLSSEIGYQSLNSLFQYIYATKRCQKRNKYENEKPLMLYLKYLWYSWYWMNKNWIKHDLKINIPLWWITKKKLSEEKMICFLKNSRQSNKQQAFKILKKITAT